MIINTKLRKHCLLTSLHPPLTTHSTSLALAISTQLLYYSPSGHPIYLHSTHISLSQSLIQALFIQCLIQPLILSLIPPLVQFLIQPLFITSLSIQPLL